jgi:hypothetical protein
MDEKGDSVTGSHRILARRGNHLSVFECTQGLAGETGGKETTGET